MVNIRTANTRHKRALVARPARAKAIAAAVVATEKPVKAAD